MKRKGMNCTSKRIFIIAVLSVLALAVSLNACGGNDEADGKVLPPPDVPKYNVGKIVSKESGKDGYRILIDAPSASDKIKSFYRTKLPKKKWIFVEEAVEEDGSTLLYFRKSERLLMITMRPHENKIGMMLTISETVGERPRGNIRYDLSSGKLKQPEKESAESEKKPAAKEPEGGKSEGKGH